MLMKTITPIKWLLRACKSVLTLLLLFFILKVTLAANDWHNVAPGIDYLDSRNGYMAPWSHVHAFKINLQENRFSLITAKNLARKYASVDEYAQFSQALLAINGGFFDNHFNPLGLRINKNKQLSPLKPISWWGVFAIKNNQAMISSVRQFKQDRNISFAVQSGPRLLIDGKIPPLRPGRAERTALGITPDGQVIILVTEHAAMSTTELAQLMKAPPLNCIHALNLDGGNSSQLYAKLSNFNLNVHGFSNVSDAVIVKTKN